MRPELEQLNIKNSEQSFRFFQMELDAFVPFWHYHPELELTLIVKGEGTRFVGDSIEPFSDFDLVLLGKNLPHHWVSVKEKPIVTQKTIIFQFNETIFDGFKECQHFKAFFDLALKGIHFKNPSESIVNRILNFESLTALEQLTSLMLLLQKLSAHANKKLLASESYSHLSKKSFTEQKFSEVNNYILEHLDKKLSVDHMAEITHMVPQSFCRWFKKHSGHSFINFLNRTRIEVSCHYLLTSTESIQNIAFSCGFETISHFNRTFKKIKGFSPSHFRRKDRNKKVT
ncbi:AraC family transcriptional regulator [Winogradskyella sp.]|uniref:AraC family transcriptional regulator n=1 Tax=Winogradskyella sp. TaxID=1883156 RepID=UPI002620220D|nr:AraC family transcriptional regulator [Winogradskyella sp.]